MNLVPVKGGGFIIASGDTLLIMHTAGATWGAASMQSASALCLLLHLRALHPLCQTPLRPEALVFFAGRAFSLLENGFLVVFESEFQQVKTAHPKYVAFSVCKARKHVMKTESHSGTSLRERSLASASAIAGSLAGEAGSDASGKPWPQARERGPP